MSLDIRTTYLNFLLTASLGIALWYRALGADRPLGGFLLALSLVFLFEYGIVGLMNQDIAGRLILVSFAFAIFLLPLLVNLTIDPGDPIIKTIILLTFITLIWAVVVASGESTFSSDLCSWTRNGEFSFGSLSFALFGLLFLTLFFLSLMVKSSLLMVILLILLIGSIFFLLTTDYACFGYYFLLLLVLLLFIYYFVPFFETSFTQQLLTK